MEGDALTRRHLHALIDRPDHIGLDAFMALIRDEWLKTDWSYRQVDIQPADPGWIDYILKDMRREDDATIVTEACHLENRNSYK